MKQGRIKRDGDAADIGAVALGVCVLYQYNGVRGTTAWTISAPSILHFHKRTYAN